jgi:hypothetical protein
VSYDVAIGVDRRQFITVGILAGAGVLAVTAFPAALNSIMDRASRFTPAADLNHERLLPLAGDTVRVASPAGPQSALIVERVTPATPYSSSNGRLVGDSFSIFFEGPAGAPLAQDTYELHHPSLGAFPVFLSPVDLSDGSSQRYEAVFNRLR